VVTFFARPRFWPPRIRYMSKNQRCREPYGFAPCFFQDWVGIGTGLCPRPIARSSSELKRGPGNLRSKKPPPMPGGGLLKRAVQSWDKPRPPFRFATAENHLSEIFCLLSKIAISHLHSQGNLTPIWWRQSGPRRGANNKKSRSPLSIANNVIPASAQPHRFFFRDSLPVVVRATPPRYPLRFLKF